MGFLQFASQWEFGLLYDVLTNRELLQNRSYVTSFQRIVSREEICHMEQKGRPFLNFDFSEVPQKNSKFLHPNSTYT